jgi:ribosomal protein S18 acetylase RimI-like enzyme
MKPTISLFWSQIDCDKPNAVYIQARYGSGRVIAQLKIDIHESAAWIASIYIQPEYRNRGLGSLLIGRAFSVCKRMNLESVGLTVRKENESAERLYRRLGFVSHVDGYEGYNQLVKTI